MTKEECMQDKFLAEIERIEQSEKGINGILQSKFTEKFVFEPKPVPPLEDFESPVIKQLITELKNAQIGFDTSMILQHCSEIILDRFNTIVKGVLGPQSVKTLTTVAHELERLSLNEDLVSLAKKRARLQSELSKMQELEKNPHEELPVALDEVAVLKPKKKSKKQV